MHPPKISVVIPSFNKFKFISETLESIFKQKYPNLEVIVQDGGSTDGTLQIIKEYKKRYPKILKWESKKDNGQLDAINKGLRKATGELFAYINADDVYERNTFNKVAESYGESPNALWFAGRGVVIDEKGYEIAKAATTYKNLLLSLQSYFFLLITNYLMQPSVFITKKAYRKYGPFTGTRDFVMEYDLWLKLGKVQMPLIIKHDLSKFRIEPVSKTSIMYEKILAKDEKTVGKYTKSPLTFFLHILHNWARIMIEKTI